MQCVNKILKRTYCSRTFSLPKCDFTPEKYTGVSLEKMLKIRKTRLNPSLTTYYDRPLALHQGYKQWLFDIGGKRYLDMFGGICTVSVGHSHEKITDTIVHQAKKLNHVSNVYFHEKIHEYAERLTDTFPGDLKVVYFVNSGSEANDLALLMARAYTRNHDIITLKNCYHGMTYQTMGLTSNSAYKFLVPPAAGIHNVINPDPYRGPWGGAHCRDSIAQTNRPCECAPNSCSAKDNYIHQFREMFKFNLRKGSLAAFFAESIQGVGGALQFPRGYLKEAHAIVKDAGGLFISDEVQTGFGRTGEHFWGFQMHEIQPDIVTMAKGIGNGFPLGAVVTTPEIANALTQASHFNTFGGNPLACAVGVTVLDIIKEEKLQENSLMIGTHLLKKLDLLRTKYTTIGDVRGKGLMIGLELVEPNGESLNPQTFLKLWGKCRDLGLLVGKGGIDGNVLRIKPPMCITVEDADFTVDVLDSVLSQIN